MQLNPTVLYFVLSDAILKHELRVIIKQWTAPELTKTMCTQGPSAHFSAWVQGRPCLNSSLGTWKKGVFTFMPSEYCTRAPCLGTKCERCLNPLSPKRDQPEISPYNINALENIVVIELSTWSGKMSLIDISTNSPHYFYWKSIGTVNENLNFNIRV